jgi:hypothetical protein
MTLWAIAKSPLMFGGDLRYLDDTTFALLTNVLVLQMNAHSTGNTQVLNLPPFSFTTAEVREQNIRELKLLWAIV